MSDNAFPFGSDGWIKAQQDYWSAWQRLSRMGGAAPDPMRNPWNQALDQWWKAVSPAAPDPVQEFYGHLIEQGKGFMKLTDDLQKTLFAQLPSAPAGDWKSGLEKAFGDMRQAMSGGLIGDGHAFKQAMAFWELPMDTWQRTVSVMTGWPGDFLETFKLDSEGDGARTQINRFLSVPGLGYTREQQDQYQKLSRLAVEYQYAVKDYMEQFGKIATASVDRLQSKVMARVEAGESLTSLRELYDVWVDACEEAYAEQVSTEAYGQIYAALVNKLMAVKKQGRAMMDETAGMLGLPTRREMDTLQCRFQDLRRELHRLKSATSRPAAAPASTTRSPPTTTKKASVKKARRSRARTNKGE